MFFRQKDDEDCLPVKMAPRRLCSLGGVSKRANWLPSGFEHTDHGPTINHSALSND
jgi:hypothetical protein